MLWEDVPGVLAAHWTPAWITSFGENGSFSRPASTAARISWISTPSRDQFVRQSDVSPRSSGVRLAYSGTVMLGAQQPVGVVFEAVGGAGCGVLPTPTSSCTSAE